MRRLVTPEELAGLLRWRQEAYPQEGVCEALQQGLENAVLAILEALVTTVRGNAVDLGVGGWMGRQAGGRTAGRAGRAPAMAVLSLNV